MKRLPHAGLVRNRGNAGKAGCACRQGNRQTMRHSPSGNGGGSPTGRSFFAFRRFHFLLFCISHPSHRIRVHSSSETFSPSPFAQNSGLLAAVQNNVFPGQGSALIETDHRAELVLPLDARLPVTLHRHSVKEACVLAIQRGILATTAECLFIFHCAERNEDKAGASCVPFSFPILHESYMATQKLLSEAFSLQEELWHQNVFPLRRLPQFP